ncbi:TonB-dependent receptor [Alistipes shahii]|uniref:TonB-dependent receptor n=1 Tax=Alistipes shahii TaxID=328814 RepID=UPI00266F7F2F|nr:TonB-dependent receptor [Alistipes shahii]
MKKLFFVRSGSTCRMLRILAAAMLLLPVNLQPVRASRQDAGAKSSLTVKMKDATLSSVFAEVERTSRYAFIYTDDVRPLLDRRVSVSVRSATIDELLSAVLKGTELTGRVRENQVIISKAPARKNAAVTPPLPAANSGREIVLQGTVISSADNKPIVGVSVYVEGTTVGATSDINGNYTLKVPAGTKHVTFAFLGYDTKKIAVADVELFKLVTLIEASNVMDDVVVVAFGTQKKESLVGAVQVVRPSTLKVTSSNLSTSFAGKIAGVISTQSSGEPGADGANFWIRGISTFGANKSPLLILDGVEIVSEMLNNIPPEAIESFSILRDATATALYGSRGANGVMIITTKNGRQSEKMAINVRLESGISMPTRVQDIADGVTYMENYNEALRTRTPAGETYVQHFSDEKITGTRNRLNPYVYPDNDWYSMLFKDFTVNENMNLNVRGGGKVVDYFLNASIFNENGILKKPAESKFNTNINSQKYLFQANVGAQLTRTTRVSLKMNTQLLFWHRPVEEVKDLFYYTMRANPVAFPAIYPKGSVEDLDDPIFGNAPSWDGGSTDINPYALLSRGYGQRHTQYITTTFSVDQDLDFVTKGLKVRGMVSFYNKTYAATYRSFSPYYYEMTDYTDNGDGTFDYNLQSIGTPGSSYLGTSTGRNGYREISLQGQIEYSRTFGKHDVNALFVYHQKEKVDNQPANDEYKVLPYREQGLAGRFTYGYDSRYLMEFNFGYNGSENFISGRRFGFFPSIAGAWVVSGEPFWEGIRSKVNLLKIRASYGLSGNDYLADSSNNIVRFPYLTTVNMNKALYVWFSPNFVKQTGHEIKTVGNPLATWEESTKLNVGLELGLFDALTLNVDVYKENRTGIFMQRRSLPSTMGLSGVTPYGNLGEVENRGVDVSLEYNKAFNKDLLVSVRGTFTYAHNEVKARDEAKYLPNKYNSVLGKPVNSVYGLVADGLFASQEEIDNSPRQTFMPDYLPGDIKYRDLNGDGVIDANDRTSLGYPTVPEILYGFGASVNYKRWDFSFFFQGTARVSLRMYDMHPFRDNQYSGFNMTQYVADDHWSEADPNPNAAYPRLDYRYNANNTQTSSFWIKNGSYLRLKSVELGFTYKSLRAYLAGTNLFIISPFKYWDPEMGSGNGLKYPLQRVVKLGLQYNF